MKTSILFTLLVLSLDVYAILLPRYNNSLTETVVSDYKGTSFLCYVTEIIRIKKSKSDITPIIVKAKIIEIYFGKIDTTFVELQSDENIVNNSYYLVFSNNSSNKSFYFGGEGDKLSKQIMENINNNNDINILRTISSIKKQGKTGHFYFKNKNNIVLAHGIFKNGVAINKWHHYYDNGKLKSIINYNNYFVKKYNTKNKLYEMISSNRRRISYYSYSLDDSNLEKKTIIKNVRNKKKTCIFSYIDNRVAEKKVINE